MTVLATALALLLPAPGSVDYDPPAPIRRHVMICNRVCLHAPHWRQVVAPLRAYLNRIAWCESRHRWHLATGNGYYGGLQFSYTSWHAVGGHGFPHWASRLEQMF